MTADVELLPLDIPRRFEFTRQEVRALARDYARANVAHAAAAKDAEIEALREEVERLDAIVQNREAIIGTHAADTRQYQQHLMRAEARAERLAEALRAAEEYIDDVTPTWATGGQGVLTTIRAALHPTAAQEGE